MAQDCFENHLDEQVPKWFAIRTNYKREKLALKQLAIQGIKAYLPIQRLLRKWNRKRRVVELPLINGYLFVKITKQEYVKVLQCHQVLDFVRFSRNLIAIPDIEIDILRRVLAEGIEVNARQKQFHEGDEVEITTGNLLGLRGKLVKIEGKKSVLIDLDYLGYTLQLSIDPAILRRCEPVLVGY